MLNSQKARTELVQVNADDEANDARGFRSIRALAVEKAALDTSLRPSSVRVLAVLGYFMNSSCKRAWPGYDRIREVSGYSTETIERSIRELIDAGYIFTERKSPITGGRALVHYGLKAIEPKHIDEMITAAVNELRRRGDGRNADPVQNNGVKMTPYKKQGSQSDPVLLDASDPVLLNPQKPYLKEPLRGECEAVQNDGVRTSPPIASLDCSEVKMLGDGVEHIWQALIAQRLGDRPKGDEVASWKAAIAKSEACHSLPDADAHALAGVIVKAGERFWPAAALVIEAVSSRASRERARLAAIAEYEAWRPLREAYIADKNQIDKIAETVPEPTWEDAKSLAEQIHKSGARGHVSDAEQQLYADRQRMIASLAQEAGIDLDLHPREAREDKREPSKTPAEFYWPNRETQGRSKQSARWVASA